MLSACAKYFKNQPMLGTTLQTVQHLLHNDLVLLVYLPGTASLIIWGNGMGLPYPN